LRSLLYVPASSAKFIAKAHERGADAVILDLEDAVAPSGKDAARDGLSASVPAVGRAGAAVYVRINAEAERRFADAEAACRAGARGLSVPKVKAAADLAELAARLAPIEAELARAPMDFIALVEDAGAVLDARAIATGPRLVALAAGGEDIATSLGARPTPEVLRLPKLLVHYAAKASGLLSLGLLRSVADYADIEGMRAAADEARTFGFDGASCIHPSLVPILNAAFAPSADEIAWAEKIVAASERAEAAGTGAFLVDGAFVDRPIVTRARALLSAAGRT